MKTAIYPRITSFLAAGFLTLFMGGQAFACLASSADMREGQAMACCAKKCRSEKTPDAARQSCQQSRASAGQEQLTAGASAAIVKAAIQAPAHAAVSGWHGQAISDVLSLRVSASEHSPVGSCRSIDRYLLTRSLRI
ncbi:MAG: hypothetical protein AB1515_04590 [Nitrospirota bacterium]